MTSAQLNSRIGIPLRYANRHGLITGPTGTGKSVSLMRLAEQFSQAGVPVFVSDVKGDLSALTRSCPTATLDLFGQTSVTIEAMGPDLISRALELSDTQAAVVEIAFAYASATAARLDSIADFRALLHSVLNDRESVSAQFGQVSAASVGVVMRALLRLEKQGGNRFFRAPGFDVAALLDGQGLVSILQAAKLVNSPRLYSAFLLWLLTELYERLPEIGDMEKPRLIFFFDEAHLLFNECPAALMRRIEQTARLIRSKGVGVYFVSQSPADIPELIRSQLAHRLEHDRALPIGAARVQTMTQDGRPLDAGIVRIAMPAAPLGPVMPPEQAERDPPVGQFDMAGYAFLALAAVVLCGLGYAAFSIYAAGQVGTAAAVAIGVWLAIRRKLA